MTDQNQKRIKKVRVTNSPSKEAWYHDKTGEEYYVFSNVIPGSSSVVVYDDYKHNENGKSKDWRTIRNEDFIEA